MRLLPLLQRRAHVCCGVWQHGPGYRQLHLRDAAHAARPERQSQGNPLTKKLIELFVARGFFLVTHQFVAFALTVGDGVVTGR